MNLALFIEELLWEHDCVILPGWGGFIANYQSAKKNPITHELFPPSRQLSFNKHLTQQDGLLQSHIAKKLFISIQEAQQHIQNWVKEHHQKLMNGEKILLAQIGVFAQDVNGQIQFIPSEHNTFLKSSFGLPTIQLQVTQPHKLIQSTEKSPYPHTKKWLVAAGLALALGLGIFATKQSLHHTDTAGWNWNTQEIPSNYLPTTPQLPENNSVLPSPESLRLITITDYTHNTNNKKAVESTASDKSKAKSNSYKNNKTTVNSGTTWVVGGVFVIKDNAVKKVNLFQSIGFTGAKVIDFDGRYYACYGEAFGEEEEINLRKKVAQVDPFAWTKR